MDESAVERPTVLTVLRHREFRALWIAEAQSMLGDQLARVALTVLAYERTHSPAVTAGLFALTFLPAVVGGALLSGLADRFPRRSLMIVCDLARAALIAAMALPGVPLWLLAVLLVVAVLIGRPFAAAQTALLPRLLGGEQFVVGTALRMITDQTAQLVGFAAGGVVVALVGPRGSLALDAATFLVSALLVARFVRHHPVDWPVSSGEARPSLPTRLTAAVRVVSDSPALRALVGLGWLAALHVVPEGVAVPYADLVGGGPRAAGLLMAAVPAGCALGATLLVRMAPARRTAAIGPMAVAAGIPLAACLLTPPLPVAVVLWMAAGVCTAYQVPAAAAFVSGVPDAHRGQVLGLVSSSLIALQGVGIVVFGLVADVSDAAVAVGSAGVAAVIIGIAPARLYIRASRGGNGVGSTGRGGVGLSTPRT